MQNVVTRVENEGKKLVIEVDLTQDFGPSSTGKTHTVANSGWGKVENAAIPGVGFKLNVFRKV